MKTDFMQFIEIAKREVKSQATPAEIAMLADNFETWVSALRSAIADVDQQIADHRDRLDRQRLDAEVGLIDRERYIELIEDAQAWEKKVARYRLGVTVRLTELENARGDVAHRLRAAIETHRDSIDEPTGADETLWATLENVGDPSRT